MSFQQIRNQIVQLEKQTDQLLSNYSTYERNILIKEDPEQEESLKSNLQSCFNNRDELIEKLNRINEFESLSTSKLQQMTRHKEILIDHKQIFTRLSNNITETKNKNNLLFSIRSDLNNHKLRNTNEIDSHDYILDESVRANSFNDMANNLLNSAYRTRDELLNQRSYLNNAQLRLTNSIQQIPGIGTLISKINTRRKRDTLILATVIAVCIILLFFV